MQKLIQISLFLVILGTSTGLRKEKTQNALVSSTQLMLPTLSDYLLKRGDNLFVSGSLYSTPAFISGKASDYSIWTRKDQDKWNQPGYVICKTWSDCPPACLKNTWRKCPTVNDLFSVGITYPYFYAPPSIGGLPRSDDLAFCACSHKPQYLADVVLIGAYTNGFEGRTFSSF